MPKLLDLFCCAGGAAAGYARAGFEVVGIDINPQPRYPYEFHQADALEYVADHWREFDAIHASPPCQGYSTMTPDRSKHPKLIKVASQVLRATGKPYVIENVEGARRELRDPFRLCGSSMGLGVRRHRWFEANFPAAAPPCNHAAQPNPVGIYGDHPDRREYLRPDGTRRGTKATSDHHASEAMGGVPWMTWHEIREAIPPAYTAHIGAQLITHLEAS